MATTKPKPKTAQLTLVSNPNIQATGSPITLTVAVPPNLSHGTFKTGEFIEIYDKTTGAIVSSHAVQRDTYTTIDKSNAAGSQTFVARLWNTGVTPRTNPSSLTSNTLTVTWIKPTITLSPPPPSNASGKAYQISYSTAGFAFTPCDYVAVTDASDVNGWTESSSTNK